MEYARVDLRTWEFLIITARYANNRPYFIAFLPFILIVDYPIIDITSILNDKYFHDIFSEYDIVVEKSSIGQKNLSRMS